MKKLTDFWLGFFKEENREKDWWERKKQLNDEREATIVRIHGIGKVFQRIDYDNMSSYRYLLYLTFLIKQKDLFYIEEQVLPFRFRSVKGNIIDHQEIGRQSKESDHHLYEPHALRAMSDERFTYDRRAAVQYAERWWNSYNPSYEKFTVDCTNYISQCLFAGGAPMHGAPVRDRGWWYKDRNWSYSWAVAHSLRWYLSGSTVGLHGAEVEKAEDLYPGDVICYDFQGDDRWDHNTIVVGKDINDMPLVNAHTDNSRNRYWSYEDSSAWTPNIKYKFFRIGE